MILSRVIEHVKHQNWTAVALDFVIVVMGVFIGLISNENVKASLRRFAMVRDRSRRQYAEAINELYRLSPRHPDAVWTVRMRIDRGDARAQWAQSAGDGYIWWNECDLEKMRSDKSFLAEYFDNVARLNFFAQRYEESISALEGLKKAIATELGVPGSSVAREDSR
jgi:hypothetical protein